MAECSALQFVSPYAFEAMQKVDVVRLAALSDPELRLLLPCLVRMALCAPADQSQSWAQDKKLILRLLSGVEAVNSIVALLSVDFHALEQDANKEQQLRHKLGGGSGESILVSQLQHGLTLEFEHSDSPRRLRLVLSELLAIMNKVADSTGEFFFKSPELFESPVYLEEAADNGAWFLCLLVANVPDSFNEVCRGLIKNGERQDEDSFGGRRRTDALRHLCKMNPSQALRVEECHLPGLGVALTLDHTKNEFSEDGVSDLVCFVSGLLLGTNAKRKRESISSVLWQMRRQLLLELMEILPTVRSLHIPEEAEPDMEPNISVYSGLKEEHVVKASALLRLYCALMGIAGLKPTDEEAEQLLQLMTSRPPATPAGVRFVSLSFCMLLAFSTLIVIKPSSLSRMKTIFTQEIFTEQVVTAHAVRVAVTSNLSANITGFLPIHCIYQLLRSRSFTKHKVSIKDWIYRQLCETTTPLHPQLLPLIDVYINSVLTPASKSNPEATNQPITEQEILNVFKGLTGLLVLYYILSYEEAILASSKCPPLMDITLHMLNGYLLASKAYLSAHLKETADQDVKPLQNNITGLEGPEVTREELKNALLAAQDSAAVQILLEICLPLEEESPPGRRSTRPLKNHPGSAARSPPNKPIKEEEEEEKEGEDREEVEDSLLCNLREVQCLVCCLVHQMFIADPNIAKLVHFQGYPCELLPLTVAGIPSMHICLDFIPELIAQPELEKQYALPKSLSVARLAINVMGTLLTEAKRYTFFMPTLPCLVSFCQAFPPLYEDIMSLLIQVGQVCASDVATETRDFDPIITRLQQLKEKPTEQTRLPTTHKTGGGAPSADPNVQLCHCIENTFVEIINMSVGTV
ncbi:Integrator complex subunit 2, partial [Ophiophagus hannah]